MNGLKQIALLFFVLTLASPDPALAQRRRRAPARRPSASATAAQEAAAADAERRAAARKVSGQIKRLSRFLYIYGGTVRTIQDAEEALGQNATVAEREATDKSKAAVAESIRNVRAGLDEIETEFGTKRSLRPYYAPVIGVGAAAEQAERLAAAGQFGPAGDALLRALGQLADTLAAMRESGT